MSYYHRLISEKQKQNLYDFNDCYNVTDNLYNTDIIISIATDNIISIVKLIVHSPVG